MTDSQSPYVHRRSFLKGLAIASAAAVPVSSEVEAQASAASARNTPADPNVKASPLTTQRSGADFMVDVCKTISIDYVAACPGSTFRGLQESFINYGGNKSPEWLTCLHEEVSVGMAHGYAKVAGKPMAAMVHGTVGTQHAAMAIYNAYCDRVPVLIVTGNAGIADQRRPGVEWVHSVQDGAATVRDFVKWDDYPRSLQHFSESMVRGYGVACAQPPGPVFITADSGLQENPLQDEERRALTIPRAMTSREIVGDVVALNEAAKLLLSAELPLIIADRYARSQQGMDDLVKLAELLQAPVIDRLARMNMPNTHPLCQTERAGALLSRADCILSLEAMDLFGQLNEMVDQLVRVTRPRVMAKAKIISISTSDLSVRANYQDFQRYAPVDLKISGDAQSTVPYLIEAVQRELGRQHKSKIESRGRQMRDAHQRIVEDARTEAALAWDATPISSARMYMELWNQVRRENWALVSNADFSSMWPHRLWRMDKHYQYIGGSGGHGVGYQPCAALGAALAHRDADRTRLPINICGDGEFNMAPTTLWTAAHHRIPYLTIIHNNRAYHQEVMHLQRMANRHNRDIRTAAIGNAIENPNVDYAKIAQGYGAVGIGPVTEPNSLAEALRQGIAAVKAGQPALVDVVMQPR